MATQISGSDGSARSLLDALPPAHAEVLLLRAAGLPDREIAGWFDVPVESVAVLLDIAARKLGRLVAERRSPALG